MTFGDFEDGESLFLDANTFVYHFSAHPHFGPACGQLMARIENTEIIGYTSTQVLSNVGHRLMTIEAAAALAGPFPASRRASNVTIPKFRSSPSSGQPSRALGTRRFEC
jgi:predicted nucleic acid-binding protein